MISIEELDFPLHPMDFCQPSTRLDCIFREKILRLVSMRFLWFCHAPGVFNPGFASGFPTELIVSLCHFEVTRGAPVGIFRPYEMAVPQFSAWLLRPI